MKDITTFPKKKTLLVDDLTIQFNANKLKYVLDAFKKNTGNFPAAVRTDLNKVISQRSSEHCENECCFPFYSLSDIK